MSYEALHEVQRPPHRPERYVQPSSLDEALRYLADHGSRARIIAGGTDLILELERRVRADVDVIVDISRIEGLDGISEEGERIALGPLVTHNQCATSPAIVAGALPLAQACLEVGSPALRNRATVVGNVVTASPANDTISALAVLDCDVHIASADAQRVVPLADFHTGVRATVLADDEMVTGLSIARLSDSQRGCFLKLGLRRAQAISVVHLAAVIDSDSSEVVDAKLALGSVAPTIVRLPAVEAALVGSTLDQDDVQTAATAAAGAVAPIDDLRAPATYRSELVEVMVRRALSALRDQTQGVAYPSAVPTLGGPVVPADGGAASFGDADGDMTTHLNGVVTEGPWEPVSLLDWIRSTGATGTKEGCAEGECGACTVLLDGVAVLSCLVPAGRADGAHLTTIEGLASDGALHPMQQGFVDAAAVQCGYCIPGFVVAASVLDDGEGDAPSAGAMKLGLSGNLCRCTGYYAIENAVNLATGGRS